MNNQFNVNYTSKFLKDIEYFVKKKKFRHLKEDIKSVTNELSTGNFIGDIIPNLNTNTNEYVYKVRVANTDTKSGKSNGYRIIYYTVIENKEVYLLAIYYKKDNNRILNNKEIEELLKECYL